jgi:hypothetical protein
MPGRVLRRFGLLAPLAAVLAVPAAVPAQPPATQPPPPADTGVGVYKKTLKSTVWVHSDRGGGKLATGTGSLVDRGRRLILTNYHVVGDVRRATVFFPVFDSGGRANPSKGYYRSNAGRLGIPGDVIELDKQADLALIRLDRVPDAAPELPLSRSSPDPGQTVHSIGNPGKSDALWVYTPGKVRQVYAKRWKVKLDNQVVTFDARVVETDSPTNPGDSGGPLVDDKGELVGVTEGGAVDAQLLSTFIDVSEVRKLLNRRSVVSLRNDAQPPKEAPKPGRDTPLTSKDEAKMFGAEALKKAQAANERLFAQKKLDFVIETYDKPPKGDADKVKAMSVPEKDVFFRDLALERVKFLKLNGVYVLVTKNPTYLYVDTTEGAGLTKEQAAKIRTVLIENFRTKKFDDGLTQAVQVVIDAKGVTEKVDVAAGPKPAHDAPLVSKDDGKFFGPDTLKKAQAASERLFKEKNTDFVVETYDAPPKGDPEKLKTMSAEERRKFFNGLAVERAKELKVTGMYVLVTRNPSFLYVEVPTSGVFKEEDVKKVQAAFINNFRDKKFDAGLDEAVKAVLDAKGLGEKK